VGRSVHAVPVTGRDALDPFRPLDADERLEQYGRLRSLAPAVHLETRDIWVVSRHEAVRHVLRSPDEFVSGLGTGYVPVASSGIKGPLIDNDPPDHTRIRRAVQRSFKPSWVADRQRAIRSHVDRLVDDAVARGGIDAVADLARPLPLLVLQDVLGLESEPVAAAELADSTFHLFGPEPDIEHAYRIADGIRWLVEDGIPHLPDHCVGRTIIDDGGDNGEVAEAERAALLFSIWVAGLDTTTNLIAGALHALAANPVQWQLLVTDPSLAPAAVEESLRYCSPIRFFMRRTVRPVDLLGVSIPADATVCALFASANRDPAVYDNPERFEIRRNPTDHLAFGAGIHLCLGAPLLRLEVTELLQALARRVPRLELDGDATPNPSDVINGWTRVPLRLS
jgi:cytochrome P450